MNVVKIILAVFGAIFLAIIIYVAGLISGFKMCGSLNQKYTTEYMEQILKYQHIAEQLDNSDIDSTRYLLTDYQDREILGMYLSTGTIKDERYTEHVKTILGKVAEHRLKYSDIYYKNADGLVPANVKVTEYLKESLLNKKGVVN